MSSRILIPLDMEPPRALPPDAVAHSLAGLSMGTSWSVQALAPRAVAREDLDAAIRKQLTRVVREMSTWEADSAVSVFNRSEAGSWHLLPEAFFTVLDAALTMAADSDGAFDPTIGPLVNLWGFGPAGRRDPAAAVVPPPQELEPVRARCGWQRVQLERRTRRVLQPGGAYLDFSGIAKGYAVDLVARALHEAGCVSWLVEVGGELSGCGIKPDGQPWWVALERPPGDPGQAMQVALHHMAVATSGDYRRYIEHQGHRLAHTIDPRTAHPVSHDLASVTVLHRQCMVADALATALTVLGTQAGMRFAQERDIAALFISGDASGYSESMTPALAAMLE